MHGIFIETAAWQPKNESTHLLFSKLKFVANAHRRTTRTHTAKGVKLNVSAVYRRRPSLLPISARFNFMFFEKFREIEVSEKLRMGVRVRVSWANKVEHVNYLLLLSYPVAFQTIEYQVHLIAIIKWNLWTEICVCRFLWAGRFK